MLHVLKHVTDFEASLGLILATSMNHSSSI
jgi:hypothetical protein